MLKDKKILIAVTGSIAAYKIATLIRLFVKNGADVKVIMTNAATQFIPALTLSTLSKNEVLLDLHNNDTWANHVMLGRWADAMIIAPASCNTIAKMANGICDNLLLAVYLSATCPVFVAPAMDEDMWLHPSNKRNISLLQTNGNTILPVNNGELASGLTGEGRMMEPDEMLQYFIPNKVLQCAEVSNRNYPLLADKTILNGPLIFLCKNYACLAPVKNVSEIVNQTINKSKFS